MNYAEILNRRLKKAGRDFAKGQAVNKKEQLQGVLHEIMQEGQDTGTFFPWTEAVQRLEMEEMDQLLLCASWGLCAVEGSISAGKVFENFIWKSMRRSRKIRLLFRHGIDRRMAGWYWRRLCFPFLKGRVRSCRQA